MSDPPLPTAYTTSLFGSVWRIWAAAIEAAIVKGTGIWISCSCNDVISCLDRVGSTGTNDPCLIQPAASSTLARSWGVDAVRRSRVPVTRGFSTFYRPRASQGMDSAGLQM